MASSCSGAGVSRSSTAAAPTVVSTISIASSSSWIGSIASARRASSWIRLLRSASLSLCRAIANSHARGALDRALQAICDRPAKGQPQIAASPAWRAGSRRSVAQRNARLRTRASASVVCLETRQTGRGYEAGTSAWARAGTAGHGRPAVKGRFAGGKVIASARRCPPLPPLNLHGKEGVDGSSPSEGLIAGVFARCVTPLSTRTRCVYRSQRRFKQASLGRERLSPRRRPGANRFRPLRPLGAGSLAASRVQVR